jgi:hypothetical protein
MDIYSLGLRPLKNISMIILNLIEKSNSGDIKAKEKTPELTEV